MFTPQHSNSWIGRTVGDRYRYRITSHLGGGGMGDVFLAVDTLLGQQVALKLLKEKLLEEGDLKQRFEREVLICAALQSENVVQVKDYGITSEGYPFYVMEYLQGQTLGQLLQKEKRLSVERALGIISQVCEGLNKAHEGVVMSHDRANSNDLVKILHRDLKPENIFLIPTTLGELVKVLDFGIAKVFSKDHTFTNTGLFMGTFQYAAPEQIEARKDIDLRADIYSIGMILYEMLSGSDPFGCSIEGNSAGGTCWLRSHVSVPPKSIRLQPNCESLSFQLEAVIMQCLRKSPNGRFASAKDLNQALLAATGFKVDLQTMIRSLTSAAETIIMKPLSTNLRTNIVPDHPDPIQSLRASQFTSYLSYMQVKLEPILLNYIGPIATILFKQASSQASSPSDLIERLIKHIPVSRHSNFKAEIKAAIATIDLNIDLNIALNSDDISSENPDRTKSRSLSELESPKEAKISQDFIDRCERELTDIIGPMAKVILKNILKNQISAQSQLIELIANKIPDSQLAAKFRLRLL